jgi:hypothetical protein
MLFGFFVQGNPFKLRFKPNAPIREKPFKIEDVSVKGVWHSF